MSTASSSGGGGLGCLSVLTIVFIVLKLVGVIGWPWVWVLAPTWVPLAVVGAFLAVVGLGWLAILGFERSRGKKTRAGRGR